MKRAIIYVFTGTGHTLYAAGEIARALDARGIATTVWEVRQPFSDAPPPNGFDCVGFGYPVHAFNTPRFMLRFVKSLPDSPQVPAFIFKTSGEPFHANDASSWPLVRLLRKKGFLPYLDRHLLMPYNIMSVSYTHLDVYKRQFPFLTRDNCTGTVARAKYMAPRV